MSNDTLIERIDEHIETGKSAGEWAEVNNAELVLLLTDIRAALSPVLPEDRFDEVAEMVTWLRGMNDIDGCRHTADLLERLERQVRDHTAYTESLEILHARIDELEKWQAKVFDVEPNIDLMY